MIDKNFFRPAVRLGAAVAVAVTSVFGLGACSSPNDDSVAIEGNFPIVFAKRSSEALGSPTDAIEFAAGGDLMMMNLASPSAGMENLTSGYTHGMGDVAEPEVSYDGTKLLFSMRGPTDQSFHIFEMDIATRAIRRLIADDAVANEGDDLGASYLPDGRIVFSSNRQTRSKELLTAEGTEPYAHLDEYERERATLLHVMNADGTNIHQISFNQSHDRNPTVLRSGEVMFARWDHVGDRNHFPIFFANPDGTSIFVRYGAFSPGNSFLQPREMPDGKVMTSLMPLSGTNLGGALMSVDIQNFSENDQPAALDTPGVGQKQLSNDPVNFDDRDVLATFGRYTSPFPLYDGTNRALVSWSPSRPVNEIDPLTGATERVEGLPLYGVYMFDVGKKTLRPIAIPPEGWSYVDAIGIAPRPVPNVIPDKPLNADLAARGLGLLNIKSVYDTDVRDLMGDSVLAPGESIPKIPAPVGHVGGTMVPDLARLKDPAQTTAAQRPARFLRVTKAVPTPPGLSRESIGETEMEMQQIVGYTEVEPDGSARLLVPADTALTLAVVDSNGMALQTHTNWLQVRPGETRTCDGCHSPRRGTALNVTPIAGNHPNTQAALAPQPGESMAETRTRLNPAQMNLKPDPSYVDVWTDPVAAGRPADPALTLTYLGLTTLPPSGGVINYPDHIAPLFTNPVRLLNTCTNCHNNANEDDPVSVGLDLRSLKSGTGRFTSYESLTLGKVLFDPVTGLPVTREDDGEIEVVRADPIVKTGDSRDSSRSSVLFEKLLERELTASAPLPTRTVNHAGMMNAAELRLLAEWADVGAQYYNDPFNGPPHTLANTRGVHGLDETIFEEQVHPILMARCAMCHQPFGNTGADPASFEHNQFVLTGDTDGDYDVTLTMVNDVCNPPANPLLLRPTSNGLGPYPHPQIGTPPGPVLSPLEADYATIRDWIATGTGTCP